MSSSSSDNDYPLAKRLKLDKHSEDTEDAQASSDGEETNVVPKRGSATKRRSQDASVSI